MGCQISRKKLNNFPKFLLRNAGTNEILVFHSDYNRLTHLKVNLSHHEPTIIICVALLLSIKLIWDQRSKLKKYRPIINIDKTIKDRTTQKNKLVHQLIKLQETYKSLKREHDIYYDHLEMVSFGHYTPHYDFEDAPSYKRKLDEIRENQKQLIKSKKAILCTTEWSVGGSKVKGRTMTNRTIKLGLNAFNVQADNTILKVKFNNVVSFEKKLEKIQDNINKLLEPNHCHITHDFFKLKIQELKLAYEYQEKLQKEKEEQRQIKQQMREEAKVRQEIAKVEAEAQKEEKIFAEALKKARQEATLANADQKYGYEMKLQELEEKLAEAQRKKERALSMAQQTRQRHVYVISNLGSFGENVYKIGMTRRLEPMDRVKELGDSSVPFEFDVHAMIHSEDAPSLEKKLHESFGTLRMNRVNNRKEFFTIHLEEIEKKCLELGCKIEFTKLAEARETLNIINSERSSFKNAKDHIIDEVDEALKKAV